MAITSSAKKAIRVSARKHVFNLRRKDALRSATKAVEKALAAKQPKEAAKLLPAAYAAIDKGAKRGVVSPSAAARQKGRLARALARASA